jgi:hypothetical protein
VKAKARQPFDPAEEAAAEWRLRMDAARDCFARAKDTPPSIARLLNLELGRRHTIAALRLLPPAALKAVFAEDAPE